MPFRLIYASATWPALTPDQLAGLIAVARRNNARLGVTGLLLYHNASVLQVLEGPQEAVEGLFDRIARDSRHGRILRLWAGPVAERAFPDWRMGLARLDDLGPEGQDAAVSLIGLMQDAGGLPGDRVAQVLIRSFLAGFRDLRLASGAG